MKKSQGFTLVELLAVISLLAVIILVSVPSIIGTIKSNEEKEYTDFENAITRSAEIYIERNREMYPELNMIGGKVEIDTQTLIDAETLKQELKNPKNDNEVTEYKVIVEVGSDEIITYKVEEK